MNRGTCFVGDAESGLHGPESVLVAERGDQTRKVRAGIVIDFDFRPESIRQHRRAVGTDQPFNREIKGGKTHAINRVMKGESAGVIAVTGNREIFIQNHPSGNDTIPILQLLRTRVFSKNSVSNFRWQNLFVRIDHAKNLTGQMIECRAQTQIRIVFRHAVKDLFSGKIAEDVCGDFQLPSKTGEKAFGHLEDFSVVFNRKRSFCRVTVDWMKFLNRHLRIGELQLFFCPRPSSGMRNNRRKRRMQF